MLKPNISSYVHTASYSCDSTNFIAQPKFLKQREKTQRIQTFPLVVTYILEYSSVAHFLAAF